MTRDQWLALARICERETEPHREIDVLIGLAVDWETDATRPLHEVVAIYGGPAEFVARCIGSPVSIYSHDEHMPRWTGSFDAINTLVEQKLPGWMCRVQWCGVSAEAWVAPDLNSPACPQFYRDNEAKWHDYAERNEIEIRPGSRQAAVLALCAAFCVAMSDRENSDD